MAILEQTMKLDQAVKAAQAVAAAKASGEARAIIDAGRDALAADLDKKLGHTVTGDRCLHALRALCHSGNFRNVQKLPKRRGNFRNGVACFARAVLTAMHAAARTLHRALGAPGRLGLASHASLCRLSPPVEMARFPFDRSLVGMASTQLLRWRFA